MKNKNSQATTIFAKLYQAKIQEMKANSIQQTILEAIIFIMFNIIFS